jgi:hypothetical protein
MTETPQTDALVDSQLTYQIKEHFDGLVFLASKLERDNILLLAKVQYHEHHARDHYSQLSKALIERDLLRAKLDQLADVVTTDHESKEAFINRVNNILATP